MSDPKNKNFYDPIFSLVGDPIVFMDEFFGVSHEDAEKKYKEKLKEGFYDDESDY